MSSQTSQHKIERVAQKYNLDGIENELVDNWGSKQSGKSIRELDEYLPDGVLIALVSRDGDSQIPEPDLTLQHGDHLTFVGRRDAVHSAIEQCHPQ